MKNLLKNCIVGNNSETHKSVQEMNGCSYDQYDTEFSPSGRSKKLAV